ncbi:MAG TPA: RodZ domain-containing protein [Rhodanobacter sp.]|jgi:cytoskeleton protein RodZ|nr:RodZ domain-containing protein [Rhodanobacter sp.]
MTPTPSRPPEPTPGTAELINQLSGEGVGARLEAPQPGFGSRLRAAREARGVDLASCASTLRLPVRVLRKLELDQYDGTDSKVYLGSYIATYGRYLGINDASIQVEVNRIRQVEAPLVATGGISHSRFLLDRYATAATYVVLTLVIAVPTLWFGVRSTLDRDIIHLAPLDATPVAQHDISKTTPGSLATGGPAVPASTTALAAPINTDAEQPLLASMAPFPGMSVDSTSVTPAKLPPVGLDDGHGAHHLQLILSAPSWIEVTQADGTRLEYGLLPAGSHKTYNSDQPLDVRIGNSSGAQVQIDGQSVGLGDFRRANVAHFRMQMQDGKASAANL